MMRSLAPPHSTSAQEVDALRVPEGDLDLLMTMCLPEFKKIS